MMGRFDLVSARLNKGLTQRELADTVGVPFKTIQRIEAGLGARPANAKKIADYFEVKVTDLIGEPEQRAAA